MASEWNHMKKTNAFDVICYQFKQSFMDLHIEPELSTRFHKRIQSNAVNDFVDFIWFHLIFLFACKSWCIIIKVRVKLNVIMAQFFQTRVV